jgi:hypothetical protein
MSFVRRGPLPCDALSGARLRTLPSLRLGRRTERNQHLFTRDDPCEPPRARPPSTLPVAGGNALLWASAMLVDFCNLISTHGHAHRASRSSHASGAFRAPLLADKSPCRLRRPSPRVAALRGLRATTSSTCVSTARSTCVGHAGRGPTRWSKDWHLPRTARWRPSRSASGTRVAGATGRAGWSPLARWRAGLGAPWTPSRERPTSGGEPRCLRPYRNPRAHRGGFLIPDETRTASTSRRLRGGIAQRLTRLLVHFRTAWI